MTDLVQHTGFRSHFTDRNAGWLSKREKIFFMTHTSPCPRLFATLPVGFWNRACMAIPVAARFFRCGIQHVVPLPNGTMMAFSGKAIYVLDADGNTIHPPARIQGSRPLSVCLSKGIVYYGEYRRNRRRVPVHVWSSRNCGKTWTPAWKFDGVRHIHGVYHDPYTEQIWVCTGDRDSESGLWVSDNGFKDLKRVVGGSQQSRVVKLLFTREFIYFGSDSPLEKNFIYRLERDTHRVHRLQAVGGSVFHGCKVGNVLHFSTAVEPGQVNTTRRAEVWQSRNGINWRRIISLKKDFWDMRLFQYGQIFFPDGDGDCRHLYYTPFATEHHHDTVVLDIGL